MANMACDVDELSNGRTILGIGTGSPEFLASVHGLDTSNLLPLMREYVEALEVAFRFFTTGEPTVYEGQYYQMYELPFVDRFWTRPERTRVPIYAAGVRPKMLASLAKNADGILGYLLPPSYVRDVAQPAIDAGARRAGRDPADIDLVSMTPCSPHPDRKEAMRRARMHVGVYCVHPTSDPMVQHMGLAKEQYAVREALFSKGIESLEHVTDDKLVDAFAIAGTPDDCRKKFKEYQVVLPHVMLHTPYTSPITKDESADTFQHILETFAQ